MTYQPSSRHLTLTCAQCGRAAVEISLLRTTNGADADRWHNRDRLERTEFIGNVTKFGPYPQLVDLFESIQRGDYDLARQLDPDFVAFYCRICDRVYCDTCWQVGPPEFDEGFYDCTWGTCPNTHVQIVDD